MNWQAFGIALASLVGGCALRAFVPYVLVGFQSWIDSGWKAWPAFEAKYAAAFGIAVVGYAVALATIPGAAESLAEASTIAAIGLGYGGGDLVREVIKAARKGSR